MITLLTKWISDVNEIITLLTKFRVGIKVIKCRTFWGPLAETEYWLPKRNNKYLIFSKYLLKIKLFQIKILKFNRNLAQQSLIILDN